MLFRSSKNAESSIFIFRVRPAIRVLSTGSRGVVMLLGIRLAVYTVKFWGKWTSYRIFKYSQECLVEQILWLTVHPIEKLGVLCRIVLNWGLCGAVSNPNLPRSSSWVEHLPFGGPVGLSPGGKSRRHLSLLAFVLSWLQGACGRLWTAH